MNELEIVSIMVQIFEVCTYAALVRRLFAVSPAVEAFVRGWAFGLFASPTTATVHVHVHIDGLKGLLLAHVPN